jgi:hypothetical protein
VKIKITLNFTPSEEKEEKKKKKKKEKKKRKVRNIFLVISLELLQVEVLGIILLSLVYVNSSCRI